MKISRKDLIVLLGNVIDHFDISLYVFLAPIMANLFFPTSNEIFSLAIAYSVVLTNFVSKPIGVYVFSILAEYIGAINSLSYSLIGVGLFTLVIGLLPTYQSIGIAAPIIFLIIRAVRDIFSSGESAIAKLYILHGKKQKEALRNSYLYQASSIFGIILGSFFATIIYHLQIDYAWRFCYVIGGTAAVIGYVLRKKQYCLHDSIHVKKKIFFKNGLSAICNNKLTVIKIAIANSFSHITYSIPFITMNHVIPMISDINQKNMMVASSLMLIFDMIAIVFLGKITLKLKANKIMRTSSFILSVSILPLWYFTQNSSFIYITFVRFWIVIWGIIYLCPLNLWCKEQVNESESYIIVGIGSMIGSVIIGKLTPAICLFLMHFTGSYMSIGIYMTLIFTSTWFVVKK